MLHGEYGTFTKKLVTDIPAELGTEEARFYKQTIHRFAEEAVFIYCFKLGRMLYADGWEEVLGYKDSEINMLLIVNSTVKQYANFTLDLNDKALLYIKMREQDLEQYSFSLETKKLHKSGMEIPMRERIGVFQAEGNELVSTIGRFQIDKSLRFGKVIRFAAYGPKVDDFEEELKKDLFVHLAISNKEREAVSMVAKGLSFKEIAFQLGISQSAVEKRILPLYKRFDVKSLSHLISFSYDNYILP